MRAVMNAATQTAGRSSSGPLARPLGWLGSPCCSVVRPAWCTKSRDTYISIWHKAMQGCRTCGALVLVIARSTGRQADVASSGYLREHRAVAVGLAVVVGFHIRRACMQHVPRVLCVCARVLFRGARGNMCDGRASSHQAAARMQIHARIKQCGAAIKPDWEQARRGQAHRRRHSW